MIKNNNKYTTYGILTANLQATLLPNMGACSLSICVHPASFPTRAITGI